MTHPLTPREKAALKPCPMCGMTDSADSATQESGLHIQSFRSPAGGDACRVQCACGVSGPSSREDWQAAEKWNRRTALASGSGDHAELAIAIGRLLPISIRETPDYAEVSFGECQAQAMTMEPDTWLALNQLPALLAENAALRSVVTDQAALHLNMMRGGVPKLAPANIGHLYRGEEAKEVIAEVDRQNPGSNTRATEAEAELREHRITADLLVSTLKADKEEAERKLAEAVGLLREWMGTWFVDADSRGESAIADDTRKFLSKEAERG